MPSQLSLPPPYKHKVQVITSFLSLPRGVASRRLLPSSPPPKWSAADQKTAVNIVVSIICLLNRFSTGLTRDSDWLHMWSKKVSCHDSVELRPLPLPNTTTHPLLPALCDAGKSAKILVSAKDGDEDSEKIPNGSRGGSTKQECCRWEWCTTPGA